MVSIPTPALSVVTPVYNGERYIERSYACLQAQTFTDWEWVVVDDGSTDRTRLLVESLSDRRIRIISYSRNRGRGYARTKALKEALGRWMVVWDIDDIYFPDRLARIDNARRAGYEFFCSYAILVDEELNITGVRGFSAPYLGVPSLFIHPTLACDLRLARRIGYPSSMTTAEDALIVVALSQRHKGLFYEDALMAYQESRTDGPRKAIYGTWDRFRCLRLARARQLVEISAREMVFHGLRTTTKLLVLLGMRVVPFTYRYTIGRRSSGKISPTWRLSEDRLDFVASVRVAQQKLCATEETSRRRGNGLKAATSARPSAAIHSSDSRL